MNDVRFFPGLFSNLELPPAEWFDPGLERSTKTIVSEGNYVEPRDYFEARLRLQAIVGHTFKFVVANGYHKDHQLRPHNDKPELWGAYAIVSLGKPAHLWLQENGTNTQQISLWLQHGDVLYLNQAANEKYVHGGSMVTGRYSLVLRERER